MGKHWWWLPCFQLFQALHCRCCLSCCATVLMHTAAHSSFAAQALLSTHSKDLFCLSTHQASDQHNVDSPCTDSKGCCYKLIRVDCWDTQTMPYTTEACSSDMEVYPNCTDHLKTLLPRWLNYAYQKNNVDHTITQIGGDSTMKQCHNKQHPTNVIITVWKKFKHVLIG